MRALALADADAPAARDGADTGSYNVCEIELRPSRSIMTRISLKGTIKVFPIVPCGKLKLKEKK